MRGTGQGLGFQALLQDLGVTVPLRVWTDSSAALGICSRVGLGKLRHIDTHTLWVQQAVRSRRVELKKVLGEENPADLLTKHSLSRERVEKLTSLFDCYFRDGRAVSAPALRTGQTSKQAIGKTDQAVAGLNAVDVSGPKMPHNMMTRADLDREYIVWRLWRIFHWRT